jgi:hypothetical protein
MRALTVWQPWASLIALGVKPYEFRRWPAPRAYVGQRIAVHAGARPVKPREVRVLIEDARDGNPGALVVEPALRFLEAVLADPARAPLGHVLCTAVLGAPVLADRVVVANDSDRAEHFNFAWPLTELEPLVPPVPARGLQGLWEWTP